MPTSLLAAGLIRIEIEFLPDGANLYASLLSQITWDERMQARKAASFGLPYNYSGISWPAVPFPDCLIPIQDRVTTRLGYRPNNCLAHYYLDGASRLGFHSDATEELEPGTGIAVISLGAERAITFRSQSDKERRECYPLASGSLLFMSAEMQHDWKHAILSTERSVGRISLTFRALRTA
jgi:alkylated DNA repair dioxygenase AlkB